MLAAILVKTVVYGSVYALAAIGFSLIFGVARVINLAQAAFSVLAAYILYGLVSPVIGVQLALAPALIISVGGAILLGIFMYKFCVDPVREHHGAVLLITVAFAMLIEQGLSMRFWSDPASVDSFVQGSSTIFGVGVLNHYLLILGVTVALVTALQLFLSKTRMGIAVRAVANDTEVASLMGISPAKVLMITIVIAAALAGVSGVLIAPLGYFSSPHKWGSLLMLLMVIVVIGGLGSIKGSIIGALIVAFVEELCIYDPLKLFGYGAAYLLNGFVMLAMVIVLVVRPAGLFGTLFEEEKL